MYVNTETGKPAWLISQDEAGVTYSDGERRHDVASHEFFGAHREPTAAEIREHGDQTHGEAARTMGKRAAKPKAAPKPAAKPKAARKTAAKAGKRGQEAPSQTAPMQQAAKPETAPAANSEASKPTVTVEPLK